MLKKFISWFLKFFLSKENKAKKELFSQTLETVSQLVPRKQEYYHEIVGNTIRIYSRKDGFLYEIESETPMQKALELMQRENGEKE